MTDEETKIGTTLRIRLPADYVAPTAEISSVILDTSKPPKPLSLEDWARMTRQYTDRQAWHLTRMLLSPTRNLFVQGYVPPPAPWWKRWPRRASEAIGTRLIRWGRALGGDDDCDDWD